MLRFVFVYDARFADALTTMQKEWGYISYHFLEKQNYRSKAFGLFQPSTRSSPEFFELNLVTKYRQQT